MLLESLEEKSNLFEKQPFLIKLCENNFYSKFNSPKNTLKNTLKNEINPKSHIKFITKNFPINNTSPILLQKKIFRFSTNNLESGGRWTDEEQRLFIEALLKYGNDWKKIKKNIVSRNMTQVRSHAQKFLVKLKKNKVLIKKGLEKSATWDNVIEFMKKNFKYEEMKNIIFHDYYNNNRKCIKLLKKIYCEKEQISTINIDENINEKINDEIDKNEINSKNNNKNCDNINEINYYKNMSDEENKEEKLLLEKFIQCFNSTSENINLNTSFEDSEYNNNYINYNSNFENEYEANINNNIDLF